MIYRSEDEENEEYKHLLRAEARMWVPKRMGIVQEEPDSDKEENPEE